MYDFSSVHGCFNEFLSDAYYDGKDGTALDPSEEMVDADRFPCSILHEVSSSPGIFPRNSSPFWMITYYMKKDNVPRVQRSVFNLMGCCRELLSDASSVNAGRKEARLRQRCLDTISHLASRIRSFAQHIYRVGSKAPLEGREPANELPPLGGKGAGK